MLTGGMTINNTGVLNFSGIINFSGNLVTGYDYSIGNITNMGTAALVFTGNVTTLLTGVTAGQFRFNDDLTVNAGTFTISNNTGIVSTGIEFYTGQFYCIKYKRTNKANRRRYKLSDRFCFLLDR